MIENVTIPAKACTCDVCAYQWISTALVSDPTHCQNRACRTREWNGKKDKKAPEKKPQIVVPKPVRVRGENDDADGL